MGTCQGVGKEWDRFDATKLYLNLWTSRKNVCRGDSVPTRLRIYPRFPRYSRETVGPVRLLLSRLQSHGVEVGNQQFAREQ